MFKKRFYQNGSQTLWNKNVIATANMQNRPNAKTSVIIYMGLALLTWLPRPRNLQKVIAGIFCRQLFGAKSAFEIKVD